MSETSHLDSTPRGYDSRTPFTRPPHSPHRRIPTKRSGLSNIFSHSFSTITTRVSAFPDCTGSHKTTNSVARWRKSDLAESSGYYHLMSGHGQEGVLRFLFERQFMISPEHEAIVCITSAKNDERRRNGKPFTASSPSVVITSARVSCTLQRLLFRLRG